MPVGFPTTQQRRRKRKIRREAEKAREKRKAMGKLESFTHLAELPGLEEDADGSIDEPVEP